MKRGAITLVVAACCRFLIFTPMLKRATTVKSEVGDFH
jgi:hypothetical protein